MNEPHPISKDVLLNNLPAVWPDNSLRSQISKHVAETDSCIIVLDDDPTGTQTVHNIWILTHWNVEDIRAALAEGEPAIYILTNSRSMSLCKAQKVNREIATNLIAANQLERRSLIVVSRSDSTLRGYYPGEVDALSEALTRTQKFSFDGLCIIPFFQEGGRFTINNIHWVQEGEQLIPAAQTPYACDAVFGYRHSCLPKWIEEKTKGSVAASEVLSVSLDTIRCGGPDAVANQLLVAQDGRVIIINAASYRDLEVFVCALHRVEAMGKRFLFRTAASFIKIAAGLPDRPLLSADELVGDRPPHGGLIVFGSCVPKSTAQLVALQTVDRVETIELPVSSILDKASRDQTIVEAAKALNTALNAGHEALIYTSREIVTGSSPSESLSVGQSVSKALVEVIKRVESEPRYMIGKGGITSSDLATHAMEVRAARVMGQILPGVPVWRMGSQCRWPGLPYIVFPGNVGDERSVADIVQILRG